MTQQILFVFGTQACVPEDPLHAAKELDCQVAIMAPQLPCGTPAQLVDRFERIRLTDIEGILDSARLLHSAYPIHGVIAYDDQAVPIVARIAAALKLPGHPVDAADAARDKALMKERFRAARIPIAEYTLAANEDDGVQWANQRGYPVVVKPVRGSASQGVIRANDEDALREAYRRVRRIVREFGLDTGGHTDTEQLVEQYVDGKEYSVELLLQDNCPTVLCVFEKPEALVGPFFEETIYVTPTTLSRSDEHEIRDLAVRAAAALGLRHGAAHCEFRLSSTGPFLLEIGARVIGGACSRVFRQVIGEDIHRYLLSLALGIRIDVPRPLASAAGAMMLPIPGEGWLEEVAGIEQATRVDGIRDVIVTASPGDAIIQFPEQGCYVGFLTAIGENPGNVASSLTQAAKLIELRLIPFECQLWARQIADHRAFVAPAHHQIQSLAAPDLNTARDRVISIVAASHFGELPWQLAQQRAQECIDWLIDGNRGETGPELWLVAQNHAVAVGSAQGDTCFMSCLGILPDGRAAAGLGEAMVRSSMALFAARGCRTMEVLLDPREPAVAALYTELGFAPKAGSGPGCCTY